MDTELEESVLEELRKGRRVHAIKELRRLRGIGLKEAKEIVNAHYADAQGPMVGVTEVRSNSRLVLFVLFGIAVFFVYLAYGDYFRSLSTDSIAPAESESRLAFASKGNLINNYDFDHGLSAWIPKYDTDAFSHVTEDSVEQNGVLQVVTSPPLNPVKNRIYSAALNQCVKLRDGIEYRFAASFKAVGDYLSKHANRVNLIWYQSDDCTTKGQFGEYLEPVDDRYGWQRMERKVTRSLNAKAALIEISQNKVSANNVPALWDAIELVPLSFKKQVSLKSMNQYTLPIGTNYLKNSTFSEDLEHWRHSGDTTWASDEGVDALGAARLAIFSDKGGYGAHNFSQCVNLGSPRVFAFGAHVKVDPTSTYEGGGILRLSWYEGLKCKGRSQSGFKQDRVEYVQGWQSIGVDQVVAPENAVSARVSFTRGINDSGNFAYFVDDVFFVAIPE
ncbi:MAG: hypothetical protein MI867_17235 [Pseudomonadales bacterium]|nr:hypothetical protein [Pseudomonadales bacterium]